MIGAFWNIRGLNKTVRLECLKDFISNSSLDFVGIQETKKDSFHQSFFNCFVVFLTGTSFLLVALLEVS